MNGYSSGSTTASTPSANTNPWFTTQAYASSRSTNSMTISAVATDNEQTSLTYTLYWNGSFSATQTKTANKGSMVTFNAISGLSQYTTYSWRVVVSDGAGGSATSSSSQRTYCSGTTYVCNGATKQTCESCLCGLICGKCHGKPSITGNPNSGITCDACGGTFTRGDILLRTM